MISRIQELKIDEGVKRALIKAMPKEICARSLEELPPQGIKDVIFDMEATPGPAIRSRPYRLGYVLEYLLHQEVTSISRVEDGQEEHQERRAQCFYI